MTTPLLPVPAFMWANDPQDRCVWYSWCEGYDFFVTNRPDGRWQWSIDLALDGTFNNQRVLSSLDFEGQGYANDADARAACERAYHRLIETSER